MASARGTQPASSGRRIILADIAAATGVSIPTVSKALNGQGQLSEATRQRVTEAARSLGFRQSQLAPGMHAGRTFLVGVLSTDMYGRFTMPILTGAEDTLAPGEIAMILCESRGDVIREQHYIQALKRRRVDGIIVTSRSSDARPSITDQFSVPVVYALAPSDDPSDMSVTADNAGGAARAVEHLIGTGRQDIAIITGPQRHNASSHRVSGAMSAIAASDARLVAEPLYGEWNERWGFEAATRLLAENGTDGFDAVFCASDQIARGSIEALRERGVSIPSQVAVVGVDNYEPIVTGARPRITSVDLNLRQVGSRAADRLLEAIAGEGRGGLELVDCFLTTRESS